MKLTPLNIENIIRLISDMRGKVNRDRIHQRVEAKIVKISSRQLFKNQKIHTAYATKRAQMNAKKEKAPTTKVPANAAELIRTQQDKIAKSEERITLLYSNAELTGISPDTLETPMRPVDFGNTYSPRSFLN